MKKKHLELLRTARTLVKLGKELETSRAQLKKLVESGASYQSKQMKDALERCILLDAQWRNAEQKYILLRDSL